MYKINKLNTKHSIIIITGFVLMVAISLVVVLGLSRDTVNAEGAYSPDLTMPNCYTERPSGPVTTSCPNDSRLVKGHCYDINQQGTVWQVSEISCDTGAATGTPFTVDTSTPTTLPTGLGTTQPAHSDRCENIKYASDHEKECNLVNLVIVTIIQVLSAAVGIVVVISVVIAGIQYITSNGNPQSVAAAKNRLSKAGLALVIYIIGFALLNWLIPGGVIK